MSVTDPTSSVTPAADPMAPSQPSDPALADPAILALLDQLRGPLTDMMTAAIQEAMAAAPKITINSGTVRSISIADGTTTGSTASVSMDGDTAGNDITAAILGDRPNPGMRVMVLFAPPGAAYILGIVGGGGLPAGALIGYTANITTDTIGSAGIPNGFIRPYGQVLEQAAAPWLYKAYGTMHNTGGETATQFRCIDMRGRIPIGLDNMGGVDAGNISLANTLGTAGGAETHTLAQGNLPSVNFTVSGGTVTGNVAISDPTHNHSQSNLVSTTQGVAAGIDYTGDVDTTSINTGSSSTGISGSFNSGSYSGGTAASGGSGTPVNHLPPVRVVNWLVRL